MMSLDFGLEPVSIPRFEIRGRVQMGEQIGRTIGFPTANIPMAEDCAIPHGIYVSLVRLNGGRRRGSVSYVGRRPTVYGTSLLLETHIFDFDRMIYGALAEVELFEQLRGDAYFDGLDALKLQIEKDCTLARRRLCEMLHLGVGNPALGSREAMAARHELVA
jgi:riboflavin kinase/FMN adenylyltransferase